MITLTHTGMQVPHTRIHVNDLDHLETHDGTAWAAYLWEETRRLGIVTGGPRGLATLFYPRDTHGRDRFDTFVAQCRSRGEPADEETVLDALTDEYTCAALVARAETDRTYVVRGFDEDGTCELFEFQTNSKVPFDYTLARASAPHLTLGPRIVRAELWMGDRWEEFYRSC